MGGPFPAKPIPFLQFDGNAVPGPKPPNNLKQTPSPGREKATAAISESRFLPKPTLFRLIRLFRTRDTDREAGLVADSCLPRLIAHGTHSSS